MFFLKGNSVSNNFNFSEYSIMMYVLIILVVLLAINFLITKIKARNSSAKYKAKKITKVSTILKVTKIYNLTNEQRDFLIIVCRKNKIPNLEVNLHSENFCNNFFFKLYHEIRDNKEGLAEEEVENKISILFALRTKIENAKKTLSNLASSIAIPEGQKITLFDNQKEQYECTIKSNTKDFIVLSIPTNSMGKIYKPNDLEKISLYYQTTSGTAYILDVRIIRYQNINETEDMVVTHSNSLKCYQRRKYKRIGINNNCNFSAVKVSTTTKGSNTKVSYEPLERKHTGKLIELSAGGCSISCNLHIRKDQYIYLDFSIDNKTDENAIGLIVDSEEGSQEDVYILHIVFVRISKKTRNKIFS